MSGTAEAATDEFTLRRASLPPWLQRNQLTLPSHTQYDCSSPEWQDCLLVVDDGAVVLSCSEGDLTLDRGAVFFLTGLHAPTLSNPHPTPAIVATVSRNAGFSLASGGAVATLQPTPMPSELRTR